MQVTVNGETIDYTLEGERALGQVVAGIEKWLNAQSLVVTSLRIGDRELASAPEHEWADLPLNGISRLDIVAYSPAELALEQVSMVGSYLEQLGAGIEGSAPLPSPPADDFARIASIARERLAPSPQSPAGRALEELTQLLSGAAADDVRAWPAGLRARALDAVSALRAAAASRLAETDHPAETLRATADELEASARRLSDVSLLLQTGKDEQAMALVGGFAELLQSVLRTIGRWKAAQGQPAPTVRGGSLHAFVGELNAVLRQTVEALGSRDTVLLGDLLEYEVAPRVAELSALLRELPGT